jgi:hypothetical protein
VDTALLKLYIECQSPQIFDFLRHLSTRFSLSDLEAFCNSRSAFFILGYLYSSKKHFQSALNLWAKLGSPPGAETHLAFQCARATIELLSSIDDAGLLFHYSRWILGRNASEGVQVFTIVRQTPLPPNDVVDFISQYGIEPLQLYLEHLIFVENNSEERWHTRLLLIYFDFIQPLIPLYSNSSDRPHYKPGTEPGLLGPLRSKLLELLDKSNSYNVAAMASKIEDNPHFDMEKVILCGKVSFLFLFVSSLLSHNSFCFKMGQHFKALQTMVYAMRDPKLAEEYCENHVHERDDLFVLLLKVYLGYDEHDQ